MFSSVFDKIVSPTAPDALSTFPPRADLPASSSTLCCLSFADHFISRYPTAGTAAIDADADDRLLLGRAGIAMSANDLEVIMQSAAELGGRLAAALAGTVRSKRRGLAVAPVSDLLGKVRGIFGNRLASVGREIRVSRNSEAERDETLLLRQIHAIKNAALSACEGEKWSFIVSSGGESLAVCSVPLPAVGEGGAPGCDFLVFDPWPRPAMKLRGSYILRFTTVRGLQLHLLSALGEIWREGGLPQQKGTKKEFVGLSVVMKTTKGAKEHTDLNARRQLEESVTSLRKAEKAVAIKVKREEIESLRRALEKSAQDKQRAISSPSTGGMIRLTCGAVEFQQISKDGYVSAESKASLCTSTPTYRQQQLPGGYFQRSNLDRKMSTSADGEIEGMMSGGGALAANRSDDKEQETAEPVAHYTGSGDEKLQYTHEKASNPRDQPGIRPKLRPPVVDVSPPLSARRSERTDERQRWSDEDAELAVFGSGRSQAQCVMARVDAGANAATPSPRLRERAPVAATRDLHTGSVERGDLRKGSGDVNESFRPPSDRPEPAISDDPLHRALLRSIEGEGLAEYSKRAYRLYRTNGVIEGGAELGKQWGTTRDNLSSSASQLFEGTSLPPSSSHAGISAAPEIIPHGKSKGKIGCEDVSHIQRAPRGGREGGPVGGGIREPVRPFSPPLSSPQAHSANPEAFSPENAREPSEAPLACTSDNELLVVDLSEAEEPVPQNAGKAASRLNGCRSRLRAPQAGRALALASANAHGVAKRHQGDRRRGLGRCVTESERSPAKAAAGPARRKEAWTKEGMVEQQESDRALRKGQLDTQISSARTSGGIVEIGSDEGDDGVLDRSTAVLRKAMPPREDRERKLRPSRQQKKGQKVRKRGESALVGLAAQDHHGVGRNRSQDQVRIACEEEEHPYEEGVSIGPSKNGPDPVDEGAAIAAPASTHSPQQVTIPTTRNAHDTKGTDAQSLASGFENVPGGVCSTRPELVKPSSPETDAGGFSHGETSETKSMESCGKRALVAKERSRDSHAFVWFGPPDTPPERQPGESLDPTGGATNLGKAPAMAGADQRAGRDCPSRQQQRSKARLILQMEVRRQRDIIEKAFQAREEEGRIRRARIGAEVLRRMHDLRLRPPSRTRKGEPVRTASCQGPKQPPLEGSDERQPKHPHSPPSRKANTSLLSPSKLSNAAKARPPNDVDNGFEPTVKAVPPEQPVPDVIEPEEAVASRPHPSEGQRAPCVVAVADNPWLHVATLQKVVHENGIPAKREPIPPPVSFNVEANALGEGTGGLNEVERVGREKTRRQERYEALRARKMAEEAERRRGQKERQNAAREEQRMRSAAAAVAATAAAAAADAAGDIPDKQYGSQGAKNDVRLRRLSQDGSTAIETSSLRDGAHTPPFTPAPSSSLPRNDNSHARHGVSSHGNSNGSGGGGGGAKPPVLAGRLASPVIRGFSQRSNRKLVRNAINFLCLAGGHLEEKKARALEALDSHLASNFVVLLAHTKLLSFKGLYACSGEEDGIAVRVFGLGPPQVDASMASGFYKYNSAAREFREVHSKTLGKTTDAISMEPTRLKRSKGLAK